MILSNRKWIPTACLILGGFGAAVAQESDVPIIEVPLSQPDRPVRLRVAVIHGGITVTTHDRDVVIVEAGSPGRRREPQRVNGMIRIPNDSLGLIVEEKDNEVRIATEWSNKTMQLQVRVPVKTSVELSTVNEGDLRVEGVEGNHELNNTNGSITAIDVSGSVVAHTTNGDVQVSLLRVAPDKPMSFATWNGDVRVSLPASLAADLHINSAGTGDIYTDFDVALEPQTSKVERETGDGSYRVRIERSVRGKVGGGGPEIRLKTYSGDIVIKKN